MTVVDFLFSVLAGAAGVAIGSSVVVLIRRHRSTRIGKELGERMADVAREGLASIRVAEVDGKKFIDGVGPAPSGTHASVVAARDLLMGQVLAQKASTCKDPLVSERLSAEASLLALRSARTASPRNSSTSRPSGASDASA